MARVISVSNQKGGVGKTTTTCSFAEGLKKKGFRVLAIDLDPQGNLGFSVGADTELSASIYDVLKGDTKIQYAIQRTGGMDVITSSILLSGIELEFTDAGREFLLRDAVRPILPFYDYILFDTPPALGILTINAFTASDAIVVPVLSDIFSLQGIAQLYETVERVKKYCNPDLTIAGILLTRFNPRTRLNRGADCGRPSYPRVRQLYPELRFRQRGAVPSAEHLRVRSRVLHRQGLRQVRRRISREGGYDGAWPGREVKSTRSSCIKS